MPETSIRIWGLVAGYGLFLIPLGILLWAKVPLVSKMFIGAIRMTVQLLLVGFYLQVVFKLNNPWLNAAWVLVMIFVADVSIIRGANLRFRKLALPLFIALLIGIAVPLLYFLGLILRLPDLLEARFVIPIGGMILGNCLRANIIGINRFYHSIAQGEKAFCQTLADGATLAEATKPYLQQTLQDALAPTLGMMSTIGLVALPGMMTGVILGGLDPMTAIHYQIAIMIAIFTGTTITILLGILLTRRVSFNDSGMLQKNVFKS
ncbi:MAG: ABC transporter permease [Phycisphaerae bacterium]|nr:ABC transporter permease [Phycisphaerae bacterium]